MKIIKKIGLLLSILGLMMYIPPLMKYLTLCFGGTVGRFGGIVSFIIGWSLFGAVMVFSAGMNYQQRRIKKRPQQER